MDPHIIFGSIMVALALFFIGAMAWVASRPDED